MVEATERKNIKSRKRITNVLLKMCYVLDMCSGRECFQTRPFVAGSQSAIWDVEEKDQKLPVPFRSGAAYPQNSP
jgi:hypothetical protein